ncbi:MAG: AI-2E family transporter [Epsilonproteobacteria bacterium]|nr:AI-2E family transporter [Campylobacterota bacterium]
MAKEQEKLLSITQLFLFCASFLITLGLLKAASEVIVPFLISLAVAIIFSPLFTFLESKKIPKIVSLVFVLSFMLLPLSIASSYIADEIKDFTQHYHIIKEQFMQHLYSYIEKLYGYGIEFSYEQIKDFLQRIDVAGFFKKLIAQANNQFSNIFLIIFMVAFMLVESDIFHKKMIAISQRYDIDTAVISEIIEKVKSYFIIKMKTSMLTGFLVFLVLWYFHIKYSLVLAVIAFLFNFIPVVGSIIAAIPAVLLALLQYDMLHMFMVTGGYLIINVLVGNILEPRIMGKGLGLSALVIFLSMTFWGWMFGPTGMILSVPLTMTLQYLFAQYPETKWVAILLSDEVGIEKEQKKLKP